MKKISILIVFILIMTVFLPCVVFAKEWDMVKVGDLRYRIVSEEDKTVEVYEDTSYKNLVNVTIPNTVQINGETYKVISIECGAFMYCENLKSVVVSEGITVVESLVFRGCTNLESVSLPEGITTLDQFLFMDCTSLKNFNIPSTVETIQWYAFTGCESIETITIPSHIKSIGGEAFSDCTNLKEVIIEEGVEQLGEYLFSRCENLKDVTIPKSVQSIGNFVFNSCPEDLVIHAREDALSVVRYADMNGYNIEYIVIPVESIEIVGNSVMEVGTTQKLSTEMKPDDHTPVDSIKYTSSNPDVVEIIDPTFRIVRAKKEGQATITAVVDDRVTATLVITVVDNSFIKGDIDNDGEITTSDLSYGLKRLTGTPITEDEIKRGDVTDDGEYTTSDLSKLLRYLTGVIDKL